MEQRHPLPPFTEETAKQKIQMAEDAWNSKDPERVSKAYTIDSEWRNRNIFIKGRDEIVQFLSGKWNYTTNSKRNTGYIQVTALPFVLNMNIRMQQVNGSGRMVMKTGSLMKTVIWPNALQVLMIWKLKRAKENSNKKEQL